MNIEKRLCLRGYRLVSLSALTSTRCARTGWAQEAERHAHHDHGDSADDVVPEERHRGRAEGHRRHHAHPRQETDEGPEPPRAGNHSQQEDAQNRAVEERAEQGANRAATDLGVWRHGYNHTLVCQQLPEPLLAIIASSEGGVCVHRSLYDEALATYCLQHELKLWLYAVNTPHPYAHDATLAAVDVVFCDDVPGVLEALA